MTQAPSSTAARERDEQVASRKAYETVIERLSKASVDKHWEPYRDIPWDDPEFLVDPADPRWELPGVDKLGGHPWYRSRPPETRAAIGLWRVATAMKIGLQFENLLKRGLLNYAYRLPNGAPEFRYVYHETIEEGHHGMMFQEFVNRTKLPIRGMPRPLSAIAQTAPLIPLISTELFFVFVLGGEDPIDHVQRKVLKDDRPHHPLEETIMRIHIAEEARHISFARHFLRNRVPRMPAYRRLLLGIASPVVLGLMARIMLAPPGALIRHFKIPVSVVSEVYVRNPAAKQEIRDSIGKTRDLCAEIGLINPLTRRIWRLMGIWAEPERA
ncbi:diiron oxygenase [Nonomuraea sp. KC401]|uniref:AurF N-oxygenase family protein n=1 Tax=unclassified Nonomuraea TaxID=2593643 RepID=UPI0010FCDED8|nr:MULTISPECIES: diiron oxygenase [unclassified Nonomuraea]NBE92976.1 diiron oxygenase [Nonomuraea sp. K271]TLF61584.1 diiron oxygenase [Nonomuraea sp. KC401]